LKSVLIVTDAWYPQLNGVVRSLERVGEEMTRRGIRVQHLTPESFNTIPLPGYGEIRLSMTMPGPVEKLIDEANADGIHIATEGPLGLIARRYCLKRGVAFSTSYHTQFPEYLRARLPVPLAWSYAYLRWFHRPSSAVLVGTPSMQRALEAHGFDNIRIWTKGVDAELFNPRRRDPAFPGTRPVFLYVGRVAVEKNIEAFLKLDLPGRKIVVGDGPSLAHLKAEYPNAEFVGPRQGEELARYFASADVFVFPSRTDTFGLVLLESLASGTPVAAFPVMGPIDVIGDAPVGVLAEDLGAAAIKALDIPREACRTYAEKFSWSASTDQFLANLPSLKATAA
jgi:glycosyltransferase involved in cell wall biosynthesis